MERKCRWAAWARENAPDQLASRVARHKSRVDNLHRRVDDILGAIKEWEADRDDSMVQYEKEALERAKKELTEAEAMLAIYL